jgi:BirA family biotin operon repressor/biotin-[acetyl-CoA-carboxylase] ligase
LGLLTLASAVSVAEAVHTVCELRPQLKWPNDLMLEGRKTCGILTEMSGDAEAVRWLVTGIGCNVNSEDFPPELAETATSLKLTTNRPVDRVRLAAEILNRLEGWHDRCVEKEPSPVLDAWKEWPNILGTRVAVTQPVTGERLEGVARDLDRDGALLLELQNGRVERVISGDVTEG